MKSKTSYFNGMVYKSLFKRFWPLFGAYLMIYIVSMPIAIFSNYINYNQTFATKDIEYLTLNATHYILRNATTMGIIMAAIFGVLIAMAAYSYLYSSKSVSLMGVIPIKREGIFITQYLAGLSFMIFANIIIFAITTAVLVANGILNFSVMLQWLAITSLYDLMFFSFASFCASLTGNIFVLPFVYAVLNFVEYIVKYIISELTTIFVYGASGDYLISGNFLSPIIRLISKVRINGIKVFNGEDLYDVVGYEILGGSTLAIYAIVGIVLAICAIFIIKHRRMETASDVVSVKPLKPIFKYCMTGGCALVIGMIIYFVSIRDRNAAGIVPVLWLLLFMTIGAFIGYFASEMLMQKTLRVFKGKKWNGFFISLVVIAGLVLAGEFNLFGYETRVPENDSIKSVSISCSGVDTELDEPENIKKATELHKSIIENKSVYEDKENINNFYYSDNGPNSINSVRIYYTLENGKVVGRHYTLYSSITDDVDDLQKLFNTDEAIHARKDMRIAVSEDTIDNANISYIDKETHEYENIELTPEQASELFDDCIVPDIQDKALGRVWLVPNEEYYNDVYDCSIRLDLSQKNIKLNDRNYDYFETTLTKSATRTLKWIEENFDINLITQGESDKLDYLIEEKYASTVQAHQNNEF